MRGDSSARAFLHGRNLSWSDVIQKGPKKREGYDGIRSRTVQMICSSCGRRFTALPKTSEVAPKCLGCRQTPEQRLINSLPSRIKGCLRTLNNQRERLLRPEVSRWPRKVEELRECIASSEMRLSALTEELTRLRKARDDVVEREKREHQEFLQAHEAYAKEHAAQRQATKQQEAKVYEEKRERLEVVRAMSRRTGMRVVLYIKLSPNLYGDLEPLLTSKERKELP